MAPHHHRQRQHHHQRGRHHQLLGGGGHHHHHSPETTVSWFMAASDFCSKTMGDLFVSLTSCFRMPDIYSADLAAAYHDSLRSLAVENRDSMGLLAAIFTGRESKARELLSLPWTNINAQYANGNTPLILAVQGSNVGLVRLLLDHPDVRVNMRGLDGYTALIRAAAEKPEMVALLVSRHDTDVNLATYYGTTALTYAIRCGNDETVQLLLSRKDIDVNFQSRHGENALIESVTYRRYDVARALVSRPGVEVDVLDHRDRTPLIMAVQYGYAPLVRLLLFSGADPFTEDDHGRNALYYALKRGSCEMAHDLVEAMSQPQLLTRLCRTVIRRVVRAHTAGHGNRLKPSIEKFKKYEVPKTLKKFLAYEP